MAEPGLTSIQLRRANELDIKNLDEEAGSNRGDIAQELTDNIGPPSISRGSKDWCTAPVVTDNGTRCEFGTSLMSASADGVQIKDYELLFSLESLPLVTSQESVDNFTYDASELEYDLSEFEYTGVRLGLSLSKQLTHYRKTLVLTHIHLLNIT